MKNDQYQNQKQLQFQFDLEIQKIKLLSSISIPKSSYLEVIWRRGQKNISTKIKPEIKGSEDEIFFGQTLSMISTCSLNIQTHEFSQKQSIVSAVIYISGSQKLFGSVTINLSSVLNSKNFYERSVKFIQEELNGRAKSKIFMKLSSNYLKEKMKGDQISIGSGANSYNNTSSYSIDRRMLEIPSKDTYSVLSYGARYSAKKQDANSIRRDDSTKKIEEQSVKQYGRYGTYTNFYTKPTNEYNLTQPPSTTPNPTSNPNLPPSLSPSPYQPQPPTSNPPQILTLQTGSNIKSISSIQSSANRLARNSQSQQNRSSVGEQSSRLLIEEQTKRSKLEAEATKNRVENQELKSKLAEYVRENMRLKEEARKFYENSDSRQAEVKKQTEQLKQRNYVLMNEIRQLKTRFDKYINLQKQCQNLRAQRDNYQKQQKSYEDALNNLRKQIEQHKYQLNRLKQSQSKLLNQLKQNSQKSSTLQQQQLRRRQLQSKLKQQSTQLEYYQNNSKSLSILLKQSQQKCKNYEKDYKNMENRVENVKIQENRRYTEMVMGKEKEVKELNQKLNMKNQECTRYILEMQKVKGEVGRVRDEKVGELEAVRVRMTAEVDKLGAMLRDANARIDQIQQQKNNLNAQIRNQIIQRSKQSQRAKQLQQSLSQSQKKSQKQLSDLSRHLTQLQMQNVQLNNLLSQKSKTLQQAQSTHQTLQSLLKQNLQQQLQLKYKSDQIQKYQHLSQQHDNLKYRCTMLEGNMREVSTQLEKCQRELKDRNRAYLLECEKGRMLAEDRANSLRSFGVVKEELERARDVIANGERQFQDMKNCIEDLQNRNIKLVQDIRKLEDKLAQHNPQKHAMQIKSLQARNRELQARDLQKIKSIQSLTKNLTNSNNQIKQLQHLTEQRLQQTLQNERTISQLQQKIQQLEHTLTSTNKQLSTATLDKKSMIKKNEMIMEELYSYKRKLEEEKDRGRVSQPSVYVRSSEDNMRIRNLENQVQKRDERIRKMEKEIISLENQNVNLSIQVMKKLEDIAPK